MVQKDEKLILCLETFRDYTGEKPEDQKEMAQIFIDTIPVYYAELQQAFVNQNHNEWHDVAHKMKGMAAFAGAEMLRGLCLYAQNNNDMVESEKKRTLEAIQKTIKLTTATLETQIIKQ